MSYEYYYVKSLFHWVCRGFGVLRVTGLRSSRYHSIICAISFLSYFRYASPRQSFWRHSTLSFLVVFQKHGSLPVYQTPPNTTAYMSVDLPCRFSETRFPPSISNATQHNRIYVCRGCEITPQLWFVRLNDDISFCFVFASSSHFYWLELSSRALQAASYIWDHIAGPPLPFPLRLMTPSFVLEEGLGLCFPLRLSSNCAYPRFKALPAAALCFWLLQLYTLNTTKVGINLKDQR